MQAKGLTSVGEFRKCSRCDTEKQLSDFPKRSNGKAMCWCKKCAAAYQREWIKAHPEKVAARSTRYKVYHRKRYAEDASFREQVKTKARNWRKGLTPEEKTAYYRRSWLKSEYSLTVADFEELVAKQQGLCGICRQRKKKLVVDHDHKTGEIRGLLCRRCNVALGLLGDTIEGIKNAVRYLEAKV